MRNNLKFGKNFKLLVISLSVIAFLLPLLVVGSTSNNLRTINSKASEKRELRIWIEPSQITARAGSKVKFNVIGKVEDNNLIIPKFSFSLKPVETLSFYPALVETRFPFRGQTVLGQVEVVASKNGSYGVEVNSENLNIDVSDLDVLITPATLRVL